LKYLQAEDLHSWGIPLETYIKTKNSDEFSKVSVSNYKFMYWSASQQIAHHTVTGCKLNVGDILGSGTISGTDPESLGCLMEMNLGGKQKIKVGTEERTWLEDGDVVNFKGVIQSDSGFKIGFGNCSGEILPALNEEEYY
jgi:fumarylacetoacetase